MFIYQSIQQRKFSSLCAAALTVLLLPCFSSQAQKSAKGGYSAFPDGVRQTGQIAHPSIIESSGVAVCGTDTNVFWTHNDGRVPVLYAIRRTGESVAEFAVQGVQVTDWEDIARDDQGYLYLADIGNNDARRSELAVHRFNEPDPARSKAVLPVVRSWILRFPDKPFDCESLFIWKQHGYVVSKVFKKNRAAIYRFPLSEPNGPVTLEHVTTLNVESPVTGADISSDGSRLGIVSKFGAFMFPVDGVISRAGEVEGLSVKFREGQIEGCCFVADGLLAVSEKREIFLFENKAFGNGIAAPSK